MLTLPVPQDKPPEFEVQRKPVRRSLGLLEAAVLLSFVTEFALLLLSFLLLFIWIPIGSLFVVGGHEMFAWYGLLWIILHFPGSLIVIGAEISPPANRPVLFVMQWAWWFVVWLPVLWWRRLRAASRTPAAPGPVDRIHLLTSNRT